MNSLETYFYSLYEIYVTGAGVKETSYYGALETLLNEVGNSLNPKVRCIINLRNQGAGIPDGGLFCANQFRKNTEGEPFTSILPERGVIEIKGTKDNIQKLSQSEQVKRYWQKYRQVLVTNYRDFLLIGEDGEGNQVELERYCLAATETEFWQKVAKPRKFATEDGNRFIEYLKRVMLQAASITSPQDVAWFLASYGRDAKSRLDQHHNLPALRNIRTALEEALGIKFEGEKGDRFFRSTLVQTLFYGIFSAWVLWHKNSQNSQDHFDWRTAVHYLRVPIIQTLFHQLSDPEKLIDLDLIEVLDWTGSALNRVRRSEFFTKFAEEQAVQYFYEPFLEAFDPQLRKELGVWYTPPEIVKYMVSRVDTVLQEELNIEDGLANPNVYILDPCCGTGAYLVEVLKQIANRLEDNNGQGYAMLGNDLKEALKNRIFGFEILTAPFVIAHLQLGLFLQNFGLPLSRNERIGVYLTNALTGWQPPDEEGKQRIRQLELQFPGLSKEKEAADEVKRGKPILVVLGNPPYNAYAGISPAEEEGLVEPYKEGLIKEWGIKKFNLDDLYVRFFRLAERCISEATGKGVVCYISNFSYLSDPSFVVMRQRFLNEFDQLWFDCMNGDSRETGKVTPEGKPDPSVFSTQYNKEGIRVGTAIGLMVRKAKRLDQSMVRFRHFWGVNKREDILKTLDKKAFNSHYQIANPEQNNRYSFRPSHVESHYYEWVKLTDLCAISPSNGLMEKRGGALIDIDRSNLEKRMRAYFDANLDWEEYKALKYGLTDKQARFDPKTTRKKAISLEEFDPKRIVTYALRPFEVRWCYYTGIRPIWNEPRPNLWSQCWQGNKFLLARFKSAKITEGTPFYSTKFLSDDHILTPDAVAIPIQLKNGHRIEKKDQLTIFDLLEEKPQEDQPFANLSQSARNYLNSLGITNPDENAETAAIIWMHALAIGYSPQYLTGNADGIRQDFPRIPLPNTQKLLLNSAQLGRQIAELLDTENNVAGVTSKPRPELKNIGTISSIGNISLNPETDFSLNVGWGHSGKDGVTMPGKGKISERAYTAAELAAMAQGADILNMTSEQIVSQLGQTTCDIYLNNIAYWKNIPLRVWSYTIGGYQVMKKWLSYREEKLLGRSLTIEEVREVMNMARRITAIILLEPQLDANYQAIKENAYDW